MATSFVETATLRLNDQSTAKVRKLNAELNKLNATANKLRGTLGGIKLNKAFNMGNAGRSLSAATNRLSTFEKTLKRTQRAASKGINVSATTGGFNQLVRGSQQFSRNMNNAWSRMSAMQKFWTRTGRAMNYAFGGSMYGAGYQVLRSGGRGMIEASQEGSAQRILGFSEERIARNMALAAKLTDQVVGVTTASAAGRLRNLSTAGVGEEGLEAIGRDAIVSLGALALARGQAQADSDMERIIKSVDFSGAFDDPERAGSLLRALTSATIVSGKDLNYNQVQRAIVVSGRAMTMSAEAMSEFVGYVEEAGRPAGQRLQRTHQIFTSSIGVAKGIKAALADAGLTRGGKPIDEALFYSNAFEWGRKHLTPILQKMGVDLKNNAQVQSALTQVLQDRSAVDFFSPAIIKAEERRAYQDYTKSVEFNKQREIAMQDFTQGAKHVRASFQNLTAQMNPVINAFAGPGLVYFGDFLNNLAKNPSVAGVAVAGLTAAGMYAFMNPAKVAMLVAGVKLSSAATRLSAAAAVLGRGGVAPGTAPKGGWVAGAGGGSRTSGILGAVGRGARMGGAIGLGLGALSIAEGVLSGKSFGESVKAAAPSLAGAVIGGIVGSLGGPIGATIGASIGGAIGSTFAASASEFINSTAAKWDIELKVPDWLVNLLPGLGKPQQGPPAPWTGKGTRWEIPGEQFGPPENLAPETMVSVNPFTQHAKQELAKLQADYEALAGGLTESAAELRADIHQRMQNLKRFIENGTDENGVPITPEVGPIPQSAPVPVPTPRPENVFGNLLDSFTNAGNAAIDRSRVELEAGGDAAGSAVEQGLKRGAQAAGETISAAIRNTKVNVNVIPSPMTNLGVSTAGN